MTPFHIFEWIGGAILLCLGLLLWMSLFGNKTYRYFRPYRNMWREETDLPGYRRFSGFMVGGMLVTVGTLLIFKAFDRF
jgi:hypothetical protein